MATIEIKDEDRQAAEQFLVEFLTELIPDADFSRGSVTRDHTVTAVAAVYALMKQEARNVRNATSLRLALRIEDDAEFTQAIENIVSNWFITRKPGRRAQGVLTLHFSRPRSGRIPITTRFTKTTGLVFRMSRDSDFIYTEKDLTARVNSRGEITSYALRVPVRAEQIGIQYEVEPGPFSHVTPFSADFSFAENEVKFSGAKDPETPEELLERVPDALTKRDLSTARSIPAVLQEAFPGIDRVVILGAGDEGMRRDLLDDPTAYFKIHLGGHVDAYVSTAINENQVYEAPVGGVFSDPRQEITLFRDATVDDWRKYVTPSDVIYVHNTDPGEPDRYLVEDVTKYYLRVHRRQPFPHIAPRHTRQGATFSAKITGRESLRSTGVAFTDSDIGRYVRLQIPGGENLDYKIGAVDVTTATAALVGANLDAYVGMTVQISVLDRVIDYSIGDRGPAYSNKVPRRTTGEFSRIFQEDGKVLLPQTPIYAIKDVSVFAPDSPDADPVTGRVTFPVRVNRKPKPTTGTTLEYQIESHAAHLAPSAQQMQVLNLMTSPESTGESGRLHDHAVDGAAGFTTDSGVNFTGAEGKVIHITSAVHTENLGEFRIVTVNPDDPTQVSVTSIGDPTWAPTREYGLRWELIDPFKYANKTVRVVYDTASQFDVIDAFVRDRDNHIPAANTLAKGFHAVYVNFDIVYTAKSGALRGLDTQNAVEHLVQFINAFPETDTLHASDIISEFQAAFKDAVGSVQMPLTLSYELYAPDGRVIGYSTQDAVSITPAKGTGLTSEDRLENPVALGVTPSTVRYITNQDLITITQAT